MEVHTVCCAVLEYMHVLVRGIRIGPTGLRTPPKFKVEARTSVESGSRAREQGPAAMHERGVPASRPKVQRPKSKVPTFCRSTHVTVQQRAAL